MILPDNILVVKIQIIVRVEVILIVNYKSNSTLMNRLSIYRISSNTSAVHIPPLCNKGKMKTKFAK